MLTRITLEGELDKVLLEIKQLDFAALDDFVV
jgi:hypothetical protein